MSKYKFDYTVKLRTAHYISYSFFDGPASLVVIISVKATVGVSWITVGILELIHEQQRRPEASALGRAGFVPVSAARATVPRVSADKVADRMDSCSPRRIIQVSALSAFDGSVLGYHGGDG
jgi:hypothetical protein